jgi:hypothetical protein
MPFQKKAASVADPEGVPAELPDADEPESDTQTMLAQLAALQQQVQAMQMAQAASGGMTPAQLEAILLRVAEATAAAQERAANPSNKTHPAISAFSYPEGDVARPKPPFKCEMFWVGFPLEIEMLTPEEVILFNLAVPGEFQFARIGDQPGIKSGKLTITGTTAADGKLARLEFIFPCRGDEKNLLPGMVSMLRDAVGLPTKAAELEAEVAMLRTLVGRA